MSTKAPEIMFKLPDGRLAQPFPWTNSQVPKPWRDGYSRVMVPFTEVEKRNAKRGKKAHILIVRNSKLTKVS